jgi:hypothetical protein
MEGVEVAGRISVRRSLVGTGLGWSAEGSVWVDLRSGFVLGGLARPKNIKARSLCSPSI